METALERYLIERWEEALDVDRVGVHDSFFELGGDSVRAAAFVNQLQRTLGEEISMATIFDVPTIAGLAARLELLHPDAVARVSAERSRASSAATRATDRNHAARRVDPPVPLAALRSDDFDEGSL